MMPEVAGKCQKMLLAMVTLLFAGTSSLESLLSVESR